MKRHLAYILSAMMAFSSLPMTAYAANFTDMDDVPWAGAETVINSVADLGLLKGYEDGTFRARNNVTYCEAMQMLYSTLMKTGAAEPLDAVVAYQHYALMDLYHIPAWAQPAVAYGLEKGIIDQQTLVTKFMNGTSSNYATREDVAKMFGNALAVRYDVDGKSTEAAKFGDYWRISVDAMPLVDLLKRLEILSGDNHGNFMPKNNINRAEMAVMLNKTHTVLTQGTGNTGKITAVTQNGGEHFYFDIEMDNGTKEGFHASTGNVIAYAGTTDQEISLSRISKGDKVSIIHNGGALIAIRVLDAVPNEAKFDVTGYVISLENNELYMESDNTGDSDRYNFSSGCVYYLNDKKVTKKELKDAMEESDERFMYVGLMLETRTEKVKGDDGKSSNQELSYISEIHATFTNESVTAGEVDEFSEKSISFKTLTSSSLKYTTLEEDCEFYLGEKEITLEKAEEVADSGTIYAQVTIGKNNKATKIVFSEETFDKRTNEAAANTTYEVRGLNDKRIIVESGGEKITYNFGSANPLKNIDFSKWDNDDKEWVDISFEKAEDFYIDGDDTSDLEDDDKDKIYCRLEFNAGGKIREIQLSSRKSAWKEGADQTERKGIIDSLENGILKFEGSSIEYKMRAKYNLEYKDDDDGNEKKEDDDVITGQDAEGNEVRYPLVVEGAVTSSLTVFERMAKSDDVELYAEITADGDNNVVKVLARPQKVTGKLIEWDRDDKEMSIELSNKTKLNLKTRKNPKLTDEDEDYFTLDHVASTGYVGSTLELGFNTAGEVDLITVTDSTYGSNIKRVKGTATGAYDGLEVKGDDGTYEWLGRKSLEIDNHSTQSKDLDKLKDMIEDDDVEVYVVAVLDDKERVEKITVTVKAAEGTLEEYDYEDDIVRIKTDDGNTFSFDCVGKVKCDVNDVTDQERLDDKCRGEEVELVFGEDGRVSEIKER